MAPCAAHGPLEPPPPSSLILSLPLDVLPIHSVVASGSCSVPLSLCCRLLSTGAVISASSTSSASSSCHTYAFHCAPLVWLVVASPGASASPSHCISVRCIGLHPVPRLLPFILVWLVVALPGASTSPLVTTLLGAASHGTPLVWLVGCIAWCLGLSTDDCRVASHHATAFCASTPLVRDSTWHCLLLLPPPYPSRTTLPSPPRRGQVQVDDMQSLGNTCCWRAKEPVVGQL
jgi:hypothetical protein